MWVKTCLLDAVLKGLLGQASRAFHCLAIIVRTPAGTVDIYVVCIEADRARLDGIGHYPIQHPDA